MSEPTWCAICEGVVGVTGICLVCGKQNPKPDEVRFTHAGLVELPIRADIGITFGKKITLDDYDMASARGVGMYPRRHQGRAR